MTGLPSDMMAPSTVSPSLVPTSAVSSAKDLGRVEHDGAERLTARRAPNEPMIWSLPRLPHGQSACGLGSKSSRTRPMTSMPSQRLSHCRPPRTMPYSGAHGRSGSIELLARPTKLPRAQPARAASAGVASVIRTNRPSPRNSVSANGVPERQHPARANGRRSASETPVRRSGQSPFEGH